MDQEWKTKRLIYPCERVSIEIFEVMKDAQMIIPHFELTIVVFGCQTSLLIAPQPFVELTSKNKINL
jgi:hypothetical protein